MNPGRSNQISSLVVGVGYIGEGPLISIWRFLVGFSAFVSTRGQRCGLVEYLKWKYL